MTEIKIASIVGETAKLIAKAQHDTGVMSYRDNSKSDLKILDVYIQIEDWRRLNQRMVSRKR